MFVSPSLSDLLQHVNDSWDGFWVNPDCCLAYQPQAF